MPLFFTVGNRTKIECHAHKTRITHFGLSKHVLNVPSNQSVQLRDYETVLFESSLSLQEVPMSHCVQYQGECGFTSVLVLKRRIVTDMKNLPDYLLSL